MVWMVKKVFYLSTPADVLTPGEETTSHPRGVVDAETCAAARRGDPRAQAELVRGLGPRLLHLALRLGCDAREAEELVGEALYRGVLKLKTLRQDSALVAWFCRILLNAWRDRLRRRERPLSLEAVPEPAAPLEYDPETAAVAGELRERVARAIAGLPPAQRAVLALHVDEGFTVAQIAAILETSPQRVKANLWHARRQLRRRLGDLLGEAPGVEEA